MATPKEMVQLLEVFKTLVIPGGQPLPFPSELRTHFWQGWSSVRGNVGSCDTSAMIWVSSLQGWGSEQLRLDWVSQDHTRTPSRGPATHSTSCVILLT